MTLKNGQFQNLDGYSHSSFLQQIYLIADTKEKHDVIAVLLYIEDYGCIKERGVNFECGL